MSGREKSDTDSLPFAFSPPPPDASPTNLQFLSTIFGTLPPGVAAWVCAFPGDPNGEGAWKGFAIRPHERVYAAALRGWDKLNTFTTFAAYQGGEGASLPAGRLISQFFAQYAVMIDDVGVGAGAKIPPSALRLEPSWVLESSPGNWQVGYLLREPCRSASRSAALLDGLIDALGAEADPGMRGVTRYGRLPRGVNWKARYRLDGTGEPPDHQLLHWRADLRYSIEEIAAAYGIDEDELAQRAHGSGGEGARISLEDDPWVEVLEDAGIVKGSPRDKGGDGVWIDLECPWVGNHTGGDSTGSAYRVSQAFECHHGGCQHRRWLDVRRWLLDHDDPKVRQRAIALTAGVTFGEDWLWEAPPLEQAAPWQDTAEDPRTVARAAIDAKIRQLNGGAGEEQMVVVDEVLALLLVADLDEVREGVFLDDVAAKSSAKKTDLVRRLKGLRKTRDEERQRRKAEERAAAARERGQASCAPVMPQLLPQEWPDRGEEDVPLPTTRNVRCVLDQTLGGVRFNEMTRRVETGQRFAGWTVDAAIEYVTDACVCNSLLIPSHVVRSKLRRVAEERSYHPFEDFLRAMAREPGHGWDGVDRLRCADGLYNTVLVAGEDLELRNLVLERWLRSIIAAGLHLYKNKSGQHPRSVLVFVGHQFSGKTTWLQRLFEGLFPGAGDCFLDGFHFDGSKDAIMKATGYLLTELGEVDSTLNRSELGQLKAFLSSGEDSYRAPYASENESRPRRTVFAGTVNNSDFLRDQTGNTRFWTLRTERLDLDSQRRLDMRQVWAQIQVETYQAYQDAKAADSYVPMPWQMTNEEVQWIESSNQQHRVQSEWEMLLLDHFDWDDPAWLRQKELPREVRVREGVNPMTLLEIRAACNLDARTIVGSRQINDALKMLTGLRVGALQTTVLRPQRGEENPKKGRFWPMPPVRTGAFDDVPAVDDDGSSRDIH